MTLPLQDREMLNSLRNGDLRAFREFFNHWYPVLYRFSYKRVQDPEACRDLMQDVFHHLWEKRAELNIRDSLTGYLFGMVHHACLNHLRSKKTGWEKNRFLWDTFNPDPETSTDAEDGYDPIYLHETEELIRNEVDKLPEECRKIFLLSRFRGLKTKAIAELLSLSPRTVETQIYRALHFLRENLKGKI
ncbi:MAG: RNA polymerase sigma-70 factor [Bacteroidales bacterium]